VECGVECWEGGVFHIHSAAASTPVEPVASRRLDGKSEDLAWRGGQHVGREWYVDEHTSWN